EFREKVRAFFDRYDLLMSPTLPTPAFDVGREVPPGFDGEIIVAWVCFTYPFILCGLPAASVPSGFTRAGLPVGLQVVARALHETDIFRAAAAFEAAHPWADKKPPDTVPLAKRRLQ